ncbi:MAG: hypothetical protein A2511_01095 [Deltaproteobacteria bacterium RIFOXYD12_FULL_50_9]|nr:MAG: hypothetical protein A2511_01095 [Deltaproteobacteria bacterium RIFOXYD12_FULL_50_9]
MPLFDFVCHSCGAEFEALVMGSSKPSCPKCQSPDLQKKMSTFAFRSGSGGSNVASAASSSGSSCGSCAGGSCKTCH